MATTRKFTGFEYGPRSGGMWNTSGCCHYIVDGTARSGEVYTKSNYLSMGAGGVYTGFIGMATTVDAPTTPQKWAVRFAMRVVQYPTTTDIWAWYLAAKVPSWAHTGLKIATDGTLSLSYADGTASNVIGIIPLNTWYVVETEIEATYDVGNDHYDVQTTMTVIGVGTVSVSYIADKVNLSLQVNKDYFAIPLSFTGGAVANAWEIDYDDYYIGMSDEAVTFADILPVATKIKATSAKAAGAFPVMACGVKWEGFRSRPLWEDSNYIGSVSGATAQKVSFTLLDETNLNITGTLAISIGLGGRASAVAHTSDITLSFHGTNITWDGWNAPVVNGSVINPTYIACVAADLTADEVQLLFNNPAGDILTQIIDGWCAEVLYTADGATPAIGTQILNVFSGTYVGDGTFRDITGLGFRPEIVFISAATGTHVPRIWNDRMWGTEAAALYWDAASGTISIGDAIMGATSDGFHLGPNADVNAIGVTYLYYAFADLKALEANRYIHRGAWLLNPNNTSVIPFDAGADWPAQFVWASHSIGSVIKTPNLATDTVVRMGTIFDNAGTEGLLTLTSSGLSIATATGSRFFETDYITKAYAAFRGGFPGFASGTFVGTGAAITVTGLLFIPTFVFVNGHTQGAAPFGVTANAVWRSSAIHAGTQSSLWYLNTALANDGITALGADSFTVGTSLSEVGNTYTWIAFPSTFTLAPILGDGGVVLNSTATLTVIEDMSGIYTLVLNKLTDTFYTGIGNNTEETKIANPIFKTGYIGG